MVGNTPCLFEQRALADFETFPLGKDETKPLQHKVEHEAEQCQRATRTVSCAPCSCVARGLNFED